MHATLRALTLVLGVACSAIACSTSPATPAVSPDGAPPDDDAAVDGGTVPPGPKSCDPYAARAQSLELLIGPKGLEASIVARIKSATTSLDVLIYEIDTKSIIAEIVAAKQRGVAVRALVDRNESAPAKATLKAAGIEVRDTPAEFTYSHSKVILVDRSTALVMSNNLNDYSMQGERNYAVVDREPGDITDLQAIFDRDWAGQGSVDVSCTKLIVSPLNARERLLALIQGSRQTLDLSVMYITDAALCDAVKARAAAGVKVRVLLASPAWIKDNATAAPAFIAASVPARYFDAYDLHAKLVVADSAAFIGSENLSANSLDHNREIGVLATDTEVVAGVKKQFESDWGLGKAP